MRYKDDVDITKNKCESEAFNTREVFMKSLKRKLISKLVLLTISANVIFAASLFADSVAQEQLRIAAIETAGNLTVTRSQILTASQLRVGDIFTEQRAQRDTQRIAKVEGVEYSYYNISKSQDGVILTYVIVEKNLVREILFRGNKKFSDKALTKKLDLVLGDYLNVFKVSRAAEVIREDYDKKGYAFATIEFDQKILSEGKILFDINEGARVKVKKIKFEGNKTIKTKALKKELKTKTRRFLVFPSYLVSEKLDKDIEKLKTIYNNRGNLDFTVERKVKYNDAKTKAYLTYVINEGAIYEVENVSVEGNEFYATDEIVPDMKLEIGKPYSDRKAKYDTKHIRDKYLEKGFVEVQVDLKRKFVTSGKVDVSLDITEGQRFRIGRIDVTGNYDTHDKVVRRVLDEDDFSPGQWYNAKLARGNGEGTLEKDVSRASMSDSTLITSIDSTETQKDAIVTISEGRTGMVMFGAGVDSSSGVIGQVVLEQRNFDIKDWPESWSEFMKGKSFKGAGQTMRLSFEPGTEVTRFSANFNEPYLMDKPVGLNVGASKYARSRESYDEDRTKLYVGVTRRYKDGWEFGLATRAENVDITDLDDEAPKEVVDVKGGNLLFGVRMHASYNTTDNRFDPTSGSIFDVSYEQVGGDYTFGILTSTYRWYKTLREDLSERKTVLETKLHAGAIVGDAPLFEKFYAGGSGSMRGFDYRGVGPKGENALVPGEFEDAIGSDWVLQANSEIAVPMASDTFAWLFFVDGIMLDDNEFRASVGTGIQILLPQWFGPVPMRFEFAAPLIKEETDDTQAFSFSVGRLF